MFIFTLEPFQATRSSETQIATTFTLFTKRFDPVSGTDVETVITTKRIDPPDDIYRFIHTDILDPNQIYYIRARRHFASSNLDHNTPSKIVKYDKAKSEALIFQRDNIIVRPYVIFNEQEYRDTQSPYFTLTGPTFKATMSGHECSHWIIRDGSEQVLFKSLYDKNNLTSIQVPKDQVLLTRSKLTVSLIYVSTVGIESEVANCTVDLSRFNFEVVSPLTEIFAGEPYTLTLRRLTSTEVMGIRKVEVVDLNTNLPSYTIENTREDEELSFTIPAHLIRSNSTVKIRITAFDNLDSLELYTLYLYTELNRIKEIEDLAYTYKNKVEEVARQKEHKYGDGIITMEIPSGLPQEGSYIPMPVVGKDDLYKFKYQDGKLINTGNTLTGVKLLSKSNSLVYIKYTENHLLLIDGWRDVGSDKVPVLLVYKHNTYHDTYDLISMIAHPNYDKYTVARNGSLTQVSEHEFLYMPLGKAELYKFDILKNTCTLEAVVPTEKKGTGVYSFFVRIPKRRILIQSGDEGHTWKYEMMKNDFDKSITLNPFTFTKFGTLGLMLPNGDNLYLKTQRNENDDDNQVLSYNYKDRGFRVATGVKFKNAEYPNGYVLLKNNELILTKRIKDGSNEDVFITYRYF